MDPSKILIAGNLQQQTAKNRRAWAPLIAVSGAFLLATSLFAAPHTLTLDPETTDVSFSLGATGPDVQGHLAFEAGSLKLEPNQGSNGGTASGELILDARGTDTGHARRDKKMHGKVLLSQIHPRIVFQAESFSGEFPATGEGQLVIEGMVELLGQQHPLKLDVAYQLEDGGFQADVSFGVPFIEWGLRDPGILFLKVDKTVQVKAETKGTWQAPPAATQATQAASDEGEGEGEGEER